MAPQLNAWMRGAGHRGSGAPAAPTPVRREIAGLLDAAAEGRQLKKEMEMLREAEVKGWLGFGMGFGMGCRRAIARKVCVDDAHACVRVCVRASVCVCVRVCVQSCWGN